MAIKKEIIGTNGEKKQYFKINRVNLDYENECFFIECSVYTDESYRQKQKDIVEDYLVEKGLWDLLNEKNEKTSAELMVQSKINYGQITKAFSEAQQYKLKDEIFTISLKNQDLRDIFYNLLKQTIELNGAEDILENNNSEVSNLVETELDKRVAEAEEFLDNLQEQQIVTPKDLEGGL